MLDGDVSVAVVRGKIDELYRPGYDIRATSADGYLLNVVLDIEGVRGRLRQLEPTSPCVSFSKPTDDDRIFKCLEWSACVREESSPTVCKPRHPVFVAFPSLVKATCVAGLVG